MIKAIAIDDEPLALRVIETLCGTVEGIDLQKTFTKPSDAVRYLKNYPVDLLFVDIQMPSITGVNLVRSLEEKYMVIFTTAYSEYAAESYELNALDYLVKPIRQTRFAQAIGKAKEYFTTHQLIQDPVQQFLCIRAEFSLIKIPLQDILWIEGLGDYLKVHIHDRKTVVARMTMKEMLENLPEKDFIRVHRSFILPFKQILSVRNKVITIPGQEIPLGNTYVEDFTKRINTR